MELWYSGRKLTAWSWQMLLPCAICLQVLLMRLSLFPVFWIFLEYVGGLDKAEKAQKKAMETGSRKSNFGQTDEICWYDELIDPIYRKCLIWSQRQTIPYLTLCDKKYLCIYFICVAEVTYYERKRVLTTNTSNQWTLCGYYTFFMLSIILLKNK